MPRIIQSDGSGIPAPFVSGRFQSECCGFKGPLFPHIYTRTRPAFKYPHISSLYFHLSPSSTALLTDRPTNRLPGACVCACCVRLLKLSVSFLVHKPHQLLFVVCRCVCVCVKASTSCILECSRYKVKGKEVVVGCGVPNVYFGEQFIFEASGTVSALHDY